MSSPTSYLSSAASVSPPPAIEKADEGLRIVTKRPLSPAEEEVERNPRARSAKLRAIERFA